MGGFRVLHVVRAAAGGMRQHVLLLAELRERSLFDMHVVGPLDGEAISRLEAARVGWTRVPLGGGLNPAGDFPSLTGVARLAREGAFDIVHVHGWKGALVGVPAALLGGTRGCIATVHNPLPPMADGRGPLGMAARAAAGATLAMCAGVIAVCGALREQLIRLPWAVAGRVVTIHNGVPEGDPPRDPHGLLAGAGLLAHRPLIVGVGRLVREKGFDILIRALPMVARKFPRAAVAIAGDGPAAGILRRLAVECGVADRVALIGFRRDARDLLALADVVAFPSRSEGLPLALLEAMFSGRPVVASRVGGIPEAVVDGVTGILVPAENPCELARAVTTICQDGEVGRCLGERARMRAAKLFGAERMVAATQKLYASVVSAGPGRRGRGAGRRRPA